MMMIIINRINSTSTSTSSRIGNGIFCFNINRGILSWLGYVYF